MTPNPTLHIPFFFLFGIHTHHFALQEKAEVVVGLSSGAYARFKLSHFPATQTFHGMMLIVYVYVFNLLLASLNSKLVHIFCFPELNFTGHGRIEFHHHLVSAAAFCLW